MKKSFKKYEKAGLPGGPNELKRFTQGFIVSERGQWDYPGFPTAVPTPTGKITMKGVEDDLLGIDNLGNAQYMTPGNEYQFEGDMVYEIPQAKKGGSKMYSKKYSRSLMARNILFTKNPLFKKSKSVKNKIFDPNSPYFASGGEIISFDFDDTLSTDRGLQMAQSMPNEKYIISARAEVTPDMIERARAAGISEDRIFATGSDKAKIAKIKELGINRHIDNKQSVINKLGSAGQIFQDSEKLLEASYGYSVGNLIRKQDGGLLKRNKKKSEPIEKIEVIQPGQEGFPLPEIPKTQLWYDPIVLKEMTQEELDAYNKAYEEKLKKEKFEAAKATEPVSFNEGKQWVTDWHNSPMYKQMVLNSYGGNQANADYLTKLRKKNIETIPELVVKEESEKSGTSLIPVPAAWSLSDTGQVEVFPEGYNMGPSSYVHEVLHSSDRPRELYKYNHPTYSTHKLIEDMDVNEINKAAGKNKSFSIYNNIVYDYPDWMLYNDPRFPNDGAVWHDRLMPNKDQMYITTHRGSNWKDNESYKLKNAEGWYTPKTDEQIKQHLLEMGWTLDDPFFKQLVADLKKLELASIKKNKKEDKKQWKDFGHGYVSIPTEVRARLGEIRYNAQKENIYDPFTEQITPEIFQNYINKEREEENYAPMKPVDELRKDFTDEEILWMLQNISKREPEQVDQFQTKKAQDGGITKLSPEEEIEFQKFYATLPENLQTDDATYDIRGYWDSEGRPESFNYDQPKQDDGYYHAYSINPNTGEYLKSPAHETFQHAVDEDRKIGYRPITNVYGRNIATENSSLADSDAQSFLRNMIGAPSYIELELDDNQIEEYKKGGYIVEDISVPSLTKAKSGAQTTGIDPAFQAKAQQVANNLGVSLEDLLGIMRHESGLNPGAVNPYTNATGLIQFMPNTAKGLGTSIEALKNMSAIEQLDYVEKYFKPIAGKAKDIGDLYMYTFLPAAVGKDDNFVIGASGSSNKVFGINQNALYKQNKGFDADKKGYYTVGDVKRRISKFSGRPLVGSSDQSIPGFESSTTRTPGEKTVVKTTIIKDMQNDDWKPGKEEEQVDPRIEQLKTFTKIIEPSLQNINNIYAAAMQQKRFGGNTRMFQDGGMLIDASDEDINNYTNNGYIVEEVDEQDQLLNKPGYGAIGVSGSSPVPEYLQPSDVTWYGSPRQMVTAPEEVIYKSPVTGRLQRGQYDPNANQEQLADAATNIRYADVAQGRAESTTPTEEIKLSDRVIKSGNYFKGLKSVKPIKGLARPKGEFYTKEEYEKSDKDKLAKSGYYAVQLKDGNYELLKKEDISNMILASGITPDQFSKNYKIGDSKSITKDFKPVYDYAQQLQAQRVGPMIDQLIYSGKSVDQAIRALVAKGEDTYEGIKQKYGEYAKTIKKDADKIYTERLEANKKKEQANEQKLKDENLVKTYLNESLEGLNDYQKQNLINLAKQQKALNEELQSEIKSLYAYRTGARDATATQAYPSSNFAQEDKFTRQQKEQKAINAARNINASVLVLKSPGLTNEERKKILSNPYKLEEILKEYNNFNAIERDNNTYFNISKDGTAEWTSPEREALKNQYQGKVTLRNGPWNNYGDGSIQMIYPEAYFMGPSGAVRAAGSGLLRGINAANKIGLNDILPAAFTRGLSLAEREALRSGLAPITLGNILTAESAAKIGTEYIPNIIQGKDIGRNVAETVVSALPLYKPTSSIGAINYGRSIFNADKYGAKAYKSPDDIKSGFKLLKAVSTLTGHQDGGMVMNLSDKEIDQYRKGGWIVEEID